MHTLFRTVVSIEKPPFDLSYETPSLFMGSCFSEHISNYMKECKLPVMSNPFGILYNPSSIASSLRMLIQGKKFKVSDLMQNGDLWISPHHHGKFSDTDLDQCLEKINLSLEKGRSCLEKCSCIFITFGTSRVYMLKNSNTVAANCHKLPSETFTRKLLDTREITNDYNDLINELLSFNPSLRFVFTVSPVRHWKDGASGNQLSKAILIQAVHGICETTQNSYYFPSYEIMMDELRDYRFYEEDMIHPGISGRKYIWQRFMETFYSTQTIETMKEIMKFKLSINHRPHRDNPEAIKTFAQKELDRVSKLSEKYPFLDWSEEKNYFEGLA